MELVMSDIKDLPGIMNMITKCIECMESQGIYQWNEHYPTQEIIEEDIRREECYLMKKDDEIISYVAINDEQSPECDEVKWITNGEKVLVIHRLCVNPEYQGKGTARKVLKFITDYASDNGYSSIRLDAYSVNRRALNLYENYGFVRTGEIHFPYREYSFYCYEKVIN